jgi:hypothetical protein
MIHKSPKSSGKIYAYGRAKILFSIKSLTQKMKTEEYPTTQANGIFYYYGIFAPKIKVLLSKY